MSLNVGGCEYYLPTENWVADERKRSKTAVLDAAENRPRSGPLTLALIVGAFIFVSDFSMAAGTRMSH